jgi:F0F1-type ATP synthase assembly protein I
MDWKQPFELAFELGLWAIGWTLVAIIGLFILALAVAVFKGVIATFKGKKPAKEMTKTFKLVKGDGAGQ